MKYTEDDNGYILIPDNPISKTGVFQYSGASISPDLEPDKIYNVYRPEEELNNPDTIDSFKLTPWIPSHVMLGDGFTSAEKVGVQGVTGETVEYRDGVLYSNLKLFGDNLKKMIKAGLKQLSCGFRCTWEITSGYTPTGQAYDVIQRNIRGNHLASVENARMGSDVRVAMDKAHFALDSIDFKPEKTGDDMTEAQQLLDSISKQTNALKAISTAMDSMSEKVDALEKKAEDAQSDKDKADEAHGEKDRNYSKNGDTAKDAQTEKDKNDESHGEKDRNYSKNGETALDAMSKKLDSALDAIEDLKKKAKGSATDAAELISGYNKTQALAAKVATHVGAFDSSGMDSNGVAKYWAEKSGVACDGAELATLNGFLHGQQARSYTAVPAVALDAAEVAASQSADLDSLGL